MTDTSPFQGVVPWHTFLSWQADPNGEMLSATVGDFTLSVFYADDAYESAPGAAWHYSVRYKGIVACHGFSIGATDDGAVACMRTATKMAAFHGLELPSEIAPRVAHLLGDPHGGPRRSRRVARDGHSPAVLARAAAAAGKKD